MRPDRGPLRDVRLGAWAEALGVTRVARLSGLDRTGVEVASAVRPRGHVLQVTNGKGDSFEDATVGALLEAAELAGAESARIDAWGSAREVAGSAAVVPASALDPDAEADWDDVRMAWRSGEDLLGGGEALVPAHAVHVPAAGAPLLGPALVRWTSNGMGAAPERDAAVLHALLEVCERDLLARAMPEGFTAGELASRLIDPRTLARWAPRTAQLAERIGGRGFRVYLLDVGFAGRSAGTGRALGLPCAAAVLVDPHRGAVPVSAGYACRVRRDDALRAALLEAAQSRATEIHGAREDVAWGDRDGASALVELLAAARAVRDARALPDVRSIGAAGGIRAVLSRLSRGGAASAVAVGLDAPPGVHVVKVLVPGLVLSELL